MVVNLEVQKEDDLDDDLGTPGRSEPQSRITARRGLATIYIL